uniref:HBS1-like protein N-terminal domain-containing protein n=1 Tax=Timema tahoe TaxID=61484 RepID=A0A7R9FF22_9NEOP|nr:unnamed protein product [Timema tahoe]
MSRHRNVRSMNYSEEYEGFDDVYGHSMEDDYSISPSDAAQFMYDRTRQPQMSAFLDESDNIAEEDETGTEGQTYQRPALSDVDEIKLLSCLEEMHNVIGDSVPEHVLIDIVLKNNFDLSKSLDTVLSNSDTLLSRGTTHESKVKIHMKDNIVGIRKMQWLHFEKYTPFSLFYKETLNEEMLFERLDLKKSSGRPPIIEPTSLYETPLKIKLPKFRNLMELLPFIPPIHHNFYKSLPHEVEGRKRKPTGAQNTTRQGNMNEREEEIEDNDDDILQSDYDE